MDKSKTICNLCYLAVLNYSKNEGFRCLGYTREHKFCNWTERAIGYVTYVTERHPLKCDIRSKISLWIGFMNLGPGMLPGR
jgi:hypothetical protein